MSKLEEFESKGFVQDSKGTNLLRALRVKYRDNFRIFKSGIQGCGHSRSSKYGGRKIFGRSLHFYYDIRRKEEFIKYLVDEFRKENPSEDINIKIMFTRLLHSHGLHWEECQHKNVR